MVEKNSFEQVTPAQVEAIVESLIDKILEKLQESMERRLVKRPLVAKYLDVSIPTVNRMIEDGTIPFVTVSYTHLTLPTKA